MKELFWFIIIFLAIGVLWFLAGGPKLKSSKNGLWISPPPAPKVQGTDVNQNHDSSDSYNFGSSSSIE